MMSFAEVTSSKESLSLYLGFLYLPYFLEIYPHLVKAVQAGSEKTDVTHCTCILISNAPLFS